MSLQHPLPPSNEITRIASRYKHPDDRQEKLLNEVAVDVIQSLLNGENTLILGAPGSGKTLLFYKVFSVLRSCTPFKRAIVTEPSISIIQEQVFRARQLGFKNAETYEALPYSRRRMREAEIIFATPNKIASRLPELISQNPYTILFVDEVDSYDAGVEIILSYAKSRRIPVMSATATLSPMDIKDFQEVYGFRVFHLSSRTDAEVITVSYATTLMGSRKIYYTDVFSKRIYATTESELVSKVAEKYIEKMGSPILVYMPWRSSVEAVARELASWKNMNIDVPLKPYNQTDERAKSLLEKGVAMIHAGLSNRFREELIGFLVSNAEALGIDVVGTPTVTRGLNLPVKATIIGSIASPDGLMDPAMFHQLIGRSGRPGTKAGKRTGIVIVPNILVPYVENVLLRLDAFPISPPHLYKAELEETLEVFGYKASSMYYEVNFEDIVKNLKNTISARRMTPQEFKAMLEEALVNVIRSYKLIQLSGLRYKIPEETMLVKMFRNGVVPEEMNIVRNPRKYTYQTLIQEIYSIYDIGTRFGLDINDILREGYGLRKRHGHKVLGIIKVAAELDKLYFTIRDIYGPKDPRTLHIKNIRQEFYSISRIKDLEMKVKWTAISECLSQDSMLLKWIRRNYSIKYIVNNPDKLVEAIDRFYSKASYPQLKEKVLKCLDEVI